AKAAANRLRRAAGVDAALQPAAAAVQAAEDKRTQSAYREIALQGALPVFYLDFDPNFCREFIAERLIDYNEGFCSKVVNKWGSGRKGTNRFAMNPDPYSQIL
ncbi:hypothetical protein P9847_26410, partial [Paenibacillus chibensis]|nr:hypothetical protein [Paenibacillus chibensis]